MTTVWAGIAVVVVLVGLVGTILPGLPGAVLVLAGLVWLAWLDDFARIGASTIGVLTALAVASYAVDLTATALGARQVGAFLGTVAGLLFGLPGLLLGPLVGAVAGASTWHAELSSRRHGRDSAPGLASSLEPPSN